MTTYLLDNNAFKLIQAGDENYVRKARENAGRLWLSSVAAEEAIVGHMSGLARARSPRNSLSVVRAHEDFAQTLKDLQGFPLFIYSAEAIYQSFTPATLRIGPQDCRIVA